MRATYRGSHPFLQSEVIVQLSTVSFVEHEEASRPRSRGREAAPRGPVSVH